MLLLLLLFQLPLLLLLLLLKLLLLRNSEMYTQNVAELVAKLPTQNDAENNE